MLENWPQILDHSDSKFICEFKKEKKTQLKRPLKIEKKQKVVLDYKIFYKSCFKHYFWFYLEGMKALFVVYRPPDLCRVRKRGT